MSLQRFADAPIPGSPQTPWGLLAGAHAIGSTSLTLLDASALPQFARFDILIDNELIAVTNIVGDVLTCAPTTATHADGAGVYHVVTASALGRLPRSMTTSGDMEYLAADGSPARLAAPSDGAYAMQWTAGVPAWTPFSISGLTPANFASANVSQWTNDAGYVTPSSSATFTNKAGNISQWTNNAGYLTSAVTSVAMSVPSILSVSGSPITSTGTLAVTLATQNANVVFAGPTSGGAATPTFRSLVAADIPSLSSVYLPLAGGTMTGAITSTLGSLSADAQALNITATYNNAAVTFGGVIKANITNTASAAGSRLFDVQLASSSKLSVDTAGYVYATGLRISGGDVSNTIYQPTGALAMSAQSGIVSIGRTGHQDLFIGTSGNAVVQSGNTFGFNGSGTSAADVVLARDAANVLAQRNGTNAQTWRLYNTYTDASNGEWLNVVWASNILKMYASKNGTGSARIFTIRGASDQYAALQVGTTTTSTTFVGNDTGGLTAYTALQLGVTANGWTATSGTGVGAETLFGGTPTSTSTMAVVGHKITGAINYSNVTPGAGSYEALKIAVTETALPTGTNYLIRASAGAAGTTDRFTVSNTGVIRSIDSASVNNYTSLLNAGIVFNTNAVGTLFQVSEALISSGAAIQVGALGSMSWRSTNRVDAGSVDVALWRDAAATLALRNSTTAQTFNVYNTYTDSSNYERGFVKWNSNTFYVGLEALGTGVATRNLDMYAASATRMRISGSTGESTFFTGRVYINNTSSTNTGFALQESGAGKWTAASYSAGGTNRSFTFYNEQLGADGLFILGDTNMVTVGGGLTLPDGKNIVVNTTTGSKIGTATTQKLGFWNATPIVQPTTAIAAATFVANAGTAMNDASTADGYTFAQVVKALRTIGVLQ